MRQILTTILPCVVVFIALGAASPLRAEVLPLACEVSPGQIDPANPGEIRTRMPEDCLKTMFMQCSTASEKERAGDGNRHGVLGRVRGFAKAGIQRRLPKIPRVVARPARRGQLTGHAANVQRVVGRQATAELPSPSWLRPGPPRPAAALEKHRPRARVGVPPPHRAELGAAHVEPRLQQVAGLVACIGRVHDDPPARGEVAQLGPELNRAA